MGKALRVAILCEYDYIKSIHNMQSSGCTTHLVAILCEYDYIKSLPLETLVWQGLPGQKPEQIEVSAMPRDNLLFLLKGLICIVYNYMDLSNYLSIILLAFAGNAYNITA